jgi:hypothetical protein
MLHSFYQLLERWGADLWAERIANPYEWNQVVLVSQMRGSDGESNNKPGLAALSAASTRPGHPLAASALQSFQSRIANRIAYAAPAVRSSRSLEAILF